jgi:RHS repeat-associated protein
MKARSYHLIKNGAGADAYVDGYYTGINLNQNKYRYGFNGMEKENDLGGDNYDFEARILDSRLGRWLSIDPLAKKYPSFSPYSAMANSPIIVVDDEGKEIKVVGSEEFRQKTLAALQKLTNDKLELKKDGTLIITQLGGANPSKYLKEGSELIRQLNKKGEGEHLVSIHETLKGNDTTPKDEKKSSTPGVGSDSDINFNPTAEGGFNTKEERQNLPDISIGHELFHALNMYKGLAKYQKDFTKNTVYDPDGFIFSKKKGNLHIFATAMMMKFPAAFVDEEELNTREFENKLRSEQGYALRIDPKGFQKTIIDAVKKALSNPKSVENKKIKEAKAKEAKQKEAK